MDLDRYDYAQKIVQLTFDLERLCRQKEVTFCNNIGLTPVEFRCLRYIEEGGYPQVQDLAHAMEVTSPRITKLLNSLEDKKHIKREYSKKDRRTIKVRLTKQGSSFIKDLNKQYTTFHKDMMSSLNDEELKNIELNIRNFSTILENFLDTKPNKD